MSIITDESAEVLNLGYFSNYIAAVLEKYDFKKYNLSDNDKNRLSKGISFLEKALGCLDSNVPFFGFNPFKPELHSTTALRMTAKVLERSKSRITELGEIQQRFRIYIAGLTQMKNGKEPPKEFKAKEVASFFDNLQGLCDNICSAEMAGYSIDKVLR